MHADTHRHVYQPHQRGRRVLASHRTHHLQRMSGRVDVNANTSVHTHVHTNDVVVIMITVAVIVIRMLMLTSLAAVMIVTDPVTGAQRVTVRSPVMATVI